MVHEGYCVDSRKIKSGDTFFACRGQKVDGHTFLEEVASRGAKRAVVAKGYGGPDFGMDLIRVEDPLLELQRLARERLVRGDPLIIAVTGSYAKTTTKEGIYSALVPSITCFKTPMNANSQIGIPLAILGGYQDEKIAVIEAGIEYPGEMERLRDMIMPDIVVMTRIAPAHLETLGGMEGILREKGKIIVPGKTGHVFLHTSIMDVIPLQEARLHRYGAPQEPFFCDVKDLCNQLQRLLGLPEIMIEPPQVVLRREKQVYPHGVAIWDCYNANPITMQQFFIEYGAIKGVRRIAVIGEMVSLGAESKRFHLETLDVIYESFDIAFLLGKDAYPMYQLMQEKGKPAFYADKLEILKDLLFTHVQKNDFIMVKGSKINQLWEIKPWVEQIFSL